MYPNVFTAALARTRRQSRCPSTDEWIKKIWYVYTMEYSSAIRKNKIMPFSATWMNLETVMQSEGSQRRRNIV